MKTRRILALLMAVLMMIGCMAACDNGGTPVDPDNTGASDAGEAGEAGIWTEEEIAEMGAWIQEEAAGQTINLKVWQPEESQEVFKEHCAAFAELFKDYADIKIELAVQGENNVSSQVRTDAAKAADVFGFPSDHLNDLIDSKCLSEVYFPEEIKAMDSAEVVEIATVDGKIYGYPETDNSYIIAYDKRLITEDDLATIESLFEACKETGKKFVMDAGNSFFNSTFLYTGGLVTEGFMIDEEGDKIQQFNDYDVDQVAASVKAFADLFKNYAGTFEAGDTNKTVDGFKNGTAAAGVVGSWNIKATKETLGENAGFAAFPTININGEAKQIINMFGYKYLGVNAKSKYPATAQVLAYYLHSEENQLDRAIKLDWTPTNINATQNEVVQTNPSVSVFLKQAENSVPQANLAQSFWNPLDALGGYIIETKNDLSLEAIKNQVELCLNNIKEG